MGENWHVTFSITRIEQVKVLRRADDAFTPVMVKGCMVN